MSDIRLHLPDQVAILGEIRDQGELLSPWAVLVRVTQRPYHRVALLLERSGAARRARVALALSCGPVYGCGHPRVTGTVAPNHAKGEDRLPAQRARVVRVAVACGRLGDRRRRAAAAWSASGREARAACARGRAVRARRRAGVRLARRDQAGQRARYAAGSMWRGGARSTSAPRRVASPTACCSAAPRTWSRSTSPTASSTGGLRQRPRVTVIERRNARALAPGELPYAPDLIVIDVSFISVAKVLAAGARLRRGAL